jgi:hypothetical protein
MTGLRPIFAAAAMAALLCVTSSTPEAQPAAVEGLTVGANDLGGVVRSGQGPEAGVWVIAETTDLPTKFIKIVVTDDQGRYLIPELPKANYTVWVRGYGLVDSQKQRAAPGRLLNLTAMTAPTAAAAAEYYPAQWWYSMMKIPDKSLFPGTGPAPKGNGMSDKVTSQGQWISNVVSQGCGSCHQLGNKPTRVIHQRLGKFPSSYDAWLHRMQIGPAAEIMVRNISALDSQVALSNFAEWTDRIAKGALPKSKPNRPQGRERNVVITMWDWANPSDYLHDEIATDRRNPTLNANGKLYGATEDSTDLVPVLDPVTHTASHIRLTTRTPVKPRGMFISQQVGFTNLPSPVWGDQQLWGSHTTPHNPMFDHKGRVWFTSRIREAQTPAFCRKGSEHPSARLYPINNAGRQVSMFDPQTGKLTHIDTCFTTHHLNFAEDENHTLWLSAGGFRAGYVGWINTKMFEETGDEAKSQGWSPIVLDTNGNGRRDEGYVGPNDKVDPTKDKQILAGLYAIAYNPVDKSIWGTQQTYPGGIVRIQPGDSPPATVLSEFYEIPFPGYGPRGGDIDRNGIYWASLASGHLGKFDRSKCKVLNGPTATGKHCPEGWTLYRFPGPQFENVADEGSAQASYYAWVDQFDTFGLGTNVPIATGNFSDSLEALVDGKWVTLRVPYPMGFHAKGLDGRIDDANGGWKGRGLWSAYAGRAPWHIEGDKERPKVVKFQLRPDPLAR